MSRYVDIGPWRSRTIGRERIAARARWHLAPLLVPCAAFAQTAQPSAASTSTAAPAPEEEILVTGFRESLRESLELKREAIVVRDSIVAEDIGKFPEANVAESLQ